MKALFVFSLLVLFLSPKGFAQDEETALFDSNGTPVAYISLAEDQPVIYMWSGKPVAYLESSNSGDGYSIYGFNGKHLGWFVGGIARDHSGNGACGTRNVVNLPKLEPLKGLKQLLPLKSLTQLEPLRPLFTLNWSSTPCGVFLFEGAQ